MSNDLGKFGRPGVGLVMVLDPVQDGATPSPIRVKIARSFVNNRAENITQSQFD